VTVQASSLVESVHLVEATSELIFEVRVGLGDDDRKIGDDRRDTDDLFMLECGRVDNVEPRNPSLSMKQNRIGESNARTGAYYWGNFAGRHEGMATGEDDDVHRINRFHGRRGACM